MFTGGGHPLSMVSPIRNLHQMNRQQPLQEMFTQEVPPLRVASARTPAARINETNRETQSLALPTPRFARKVSTWNLPKIVKGAYPQNIMVSNRGSRSRERIWINSLTLQHSSVGRRASRPTNVVVLQSEHEQKDIALVR